jgi:hypothetical protein
VIAANRTPLAEFEVMKSFERGDQRGRGHWRRSKGRRFALRNDEE